eukprot:tig00020805_g14001.t1
MQAAFLMAQNDPAADAAMQEQARPAPRPARTLSPMPRPMPLPMHMPMPMPPVFGEFDEVICRCGLAKFEAPEAEPPVGPGTVEAIRKIMEFLDEQHQARVALGLLNTRTGRAAPSRGARGAQSPSGEADVAEAEAEAKLKKARTPPPRRAILEEKTAAERRRVDAAYSLPPPVRKPPEAAAAAPNGRQK